MTWNRALWKPRKKSPNSIKAGEHHFIGPDGKRHQRRATDVCLPSSVARIDLDHMDRKQLQAFIDSVGDMTMLEWARKLFPQRPIHYPRAARRLYRMAWMKLAHKGYEKEYRTLPPFAQWRSVFNPAACMEPSNMLDGKKRRKAANMT